VFAIRNSPPISAAPRAADQGCEASTCAQFPEDSARLAHPVRPQSFLKYRNFYTADRYEKGAK